jgi:hypothetical protein
MKSSESGVSSRAGSTIGNQALARRSQILVARERDVDQIIDTWRATEVAVAKKLLFKAVLQRRVEEVLT